MHTRTQSPCSGGRGEKRNSGTAKGRSRRRLGREGSIIARAENPREAEHDLLHEPADDRTRNRVSRQRNADTRLRRSIALWLSRSQSLDLASRKQNLMMLNAGIACGQY